MTSQATMTQARMTRKTAWQSDGAGAQPLRCGHFGLSGLVSSSTPITAAALLVLVACLACCLPKALRYVSPVYWAVLLGTDLRKKAGNCLHGLLTQATQLRRTCK